MKPFLTLLAFLPLVSCVSSPPPEPKREELVPKPEPEVRTRIVYVNGPAPVPVAVLRTFDATGKATGEHRVLGKITIKPPGFFAEFTKDDGPKRLYIRESTVTLTAE